jgi:hypothetical protein
MDQEHVPPRWEGSDAGQELRSREEARARREANHDGMRWRSVRLCSRHLKAPCQIRCSDAARERRVTTTVENITFYVKRYF